MAKTELIKLCTCRKPHVFRCSGVPTKPELRVLRCECGQPVTHIFYPPPEPTRFKLLEVD